MTKQNFDINKLRVASPCSASWEAMTGDARRRFCDSCQLNVYNFSEMTADEVRKLVTETEGRICGKLYKRADGTVLVKDCPTGLRAFQKRIVRFAGAALTTVFALFSIGFGQNKSKNENACKTAGLISRVESRNLNLVEGTITDPNCAIVAGAKITLINEDTKREYQATSNKNGYYSILLNAPGRYIYKADANGFNPHSEKVVINSSESLQMNTRLEVGAFIGVVVIIDQKTSIDPKSSSNTFKITREMMDNLPH